MSFDPGVDAVEWNNDPYGQPSPFLLLNYHLDRLIAAANAHQWSAANAALSYESLHSAAQQAIDHALAADDSASAFKIRFVLSKDGVLSASASKVAPFKSDPTGASFSKPDIDTKSLYGPLFTIYLDSQPSPTNIFTVTKTTRRSVYDEARARKNLAALTDPSVALVDVLLYNPQGMITETSLANVAIYRNGLWFTPNASTGCLPGVLRRWLLEQGRIREDADQRLTKDSIQDGDWVMLLNGVHGCRLGRVCI